MKRQQAGFTLVEIAIVLIIIGLLLGSILKGQEMINQAKIKGVLADFSGISAAYYGYQYRYGQIPGDDPNAATRWTTPLPATAGNGNGVVEGSYNNDGDPCVATVEACSWWDHLRRSGFVSGTGSNQPYNKLAGMIGVQTGNAAGGLTLGFDGAATGGFGGLIVCSANLPERVAIGVDTHLDDGVPIAGTVRGLLQSSANQSPANQATTAYVETGSTQYLVCRAF
jgi:prepilin-type N-terminal cleavage/methylation domain-containing protein